MRKWMTGTEPARSNSGLGGSAVRADQPQAPVGHALQTVRECMYQICTFSSVPPFSFFPQTGLRCYLDIGMIPHHRDRGSSHASTIFFALVAHQSGKGVVHMCILYQLCLSFTAAKTNG